MSRKKKCEIHGKVEPCEECEAAKKPRKKYALNGKEFGYLCWRLIDLFTEDEFDEYISPLIHDLCMARGLDYHAIMEQYSGEYLERDLAREKDLPVN